MANTEKELRERFEEIYNDLEATTLLLDVWHDIGKKEPQQLIAEHMFLLGAVHALRMFNGYEVPEIELAFKQAEKFISREELECMLKLFMQPESSTQSMLCVH